MSSILKALKELEGQNAPVTPATSAWEEEWSLGRAAETFGIIAVGLLLGVGGFLLLVWLLGPGFMDGAPPAGAVSEPEAAAPEAAARVAPGAARAATPAGAPPAWLGRAEPPRGRVSGSSPAAAAESPIASASAERPDAPATDEVPAEDADAPRAARPRVSDVALGAIHYSDDEKARSVTLQLDGSAVTLREGQSTGGIEVQLIMPEAVYVRRGAEVILLTPGG